MIVIGLTGSIGMGKSTAAARFRELGIAVFDADAQVHELYRGAAVPEIERAFPGTTRDGAVDRAKLLAELMRQPDGFKRLEAIVHPLVRGAERAFLTEQHAAGAMAAVLEIPLLFETGGDKLVDATVVVSAPAEAQRARVLARPGMTDAKLDEILARQMSDGEKRARADFVVETSGTIPQTQAAIDKLIPALLRMDAVAYHRHWGTA
ncbi:MAG: dephospho-CoA kinase [Hyphomicrobiaceae bacterium]